MSRTHNRTWVETSTTRNTLQSPPSSSTALVELSDTRDVHFTAKNSSSVCVALVHWTMTHTTTVPPQNIGVHPEKGSETYICTPQFHEHGDGRGAFLHSHQCKPGPVTCPPLDGTCRSWPAWHKADFSVLHVVGPDLKRHQQSIDWGQVLDRHKARPPDDQKPMRRDRCETGLTQS